MPDLQNPKQTGEREGFSSWSGFNDTADRRAHAAERSRQSGTVTAKASRILASAVGAIPAKVGS